MKAMIYASVHHGNTKKILDAIAKECEVELIDETRASSKVIVKLKNVLKRAGDRYGLLC